MGIRISELPAAGALAGDELLELSRLSSVVTITATTISADVASEGGIFDDSADGFLAAGFAVGDSVHVEGFAETGNNLFSARITALFAGEMVIGGADGSTITTEAAGESVTITKWESVQAEVPAPGPARDDVTALSIASGVVDIDCALGDYFTLALNANVTSITFSNLPGSGKGASKMIRITQDSTPRTVAWPASFRWAGGTPGAVSTGNGAIDVLAITTFNDGTAWNATLAKAWG